MQKTCETCYYNNAGNGRCATMHEKMGNCWADEAEAMRREMAIQKNSAIYLPVNAMPKELKEKRKETQKHNLKLRGGKTSKEVLDKHFNRLYLQHLTDTEISKKLHVNIAAVSRYRRNKDLPKRTKNGRPAATETVR